MDYSTLEIVAISIVAPICFGLWGALLFSCAAKGGANKKQKEEL